MGPQVHTSSVQAEARRGARGPGRRRAGVPGRDDPRPQGAVDIEDAGDGARVAAQEAANAQLRGYALHRAHCHPPRDKPSETLDHLYIKDGPTINESLDVKEQILLTQRQVRNFSDTLNIPELEVELERAIWQVEQALQKGEEAAKVHVPSPSEKSKDDGVKKDAPDAGEKGKKE
ncbi:unnamed protein product, partial [Clonostachys solani]